MGKIIHRVTDEILFEYEGTITEGIRQALALGIDLRYATFRIVNGEMWELESIDWKGKDLTGIDLRYCKALNQNFKGCNFTQATLCKSDFTGSNFEDCIFDKTMITPSKVENCNFKNVNLSTALRDFTDFTKARNTNV